MYSISALKVVRQIVSQGYVYSLKTGFRAIKVFLYLGDHLKLVQFMHSDTDLLELIKNQPRLIYKYLGNYLAFNFSTQEKLTILTNHYKFLLKNTQNDFFKIILKKSVIWCENQDEDTYCISLSFPFGIDFEGDLSLIFELNNVPIYTISFTFIPGELMNFQADQVIFVGRLQGTKNFELIRKATKSLHDIAPSALLMAALQGVALSCEADTIVGVSNDEQLSSTDKDNFFNYDHFWNSFGAEKNEKNLFFLPLPFPEKPIESIKPNHRRRTLKKRKYKDQVREDVFTHFRDFLIKPDQDHIPGNQPTYNTPVESPVTVNAVTKNN